MVIGHQVYLGEFQRHNGNVDSNGMPTYTTNDDWDPVVTNWPCEKISAGGDETQRGRQTTSYDNDVFRGDAAALRYIVDTQCRLVVDGTVYGIRHIHGLSQLSIFAEIEVTDEKR